MINCQRKNKQSINFFERIMGIEPISSAWKAENLPLIHIRKKFLVYFIINTCFYSCIKDMSFVRPLDNNK
jgi:hypothetical protein